MTSSTPQEMIEIPAPKPVGVENAAFQDVEIKVDIENMKGDQPTKQNDDIQEEESANSIDDVLRELENLSDTVIEVIWAPFLKFFARIFGEDVEQQ